MNLLALEPLSAKTSGSPQICIAVLDGLIDLKHPCFLGADLTLLPTLVTGEANPNGGMSLHGTHVASIIFGQSGTPVRGIAPQCKGLIVPVFAHEGRQLSQLDLARAIEQAVNAGAHIINISGGQLTDEGEAEGWLKRSVQLCQKNNVLIVAAAGNDGCACLHVPAAMPAVLAVGAMDEQGKPIDFSNWGESYQTQGILAPGENILGAKPGGGTTRLSGTSFATPIATGVAALLLSLQIQRGETPDPQKVRAAILNSALPCTIADSSDQSRCLVGKINIPGSLEYLFGGTVSNALETVTASGCGCGQGSGEQ
ncbi:S8 family serine peptidase, partial [Nostoc sp. 'Peltigera membranacea cyanobiont' 232]|uniref:S8 family serine peptidase n=2 Tax=unclassified Nostoc TaxID=2593658 RepID=UPI000B9F4DCE